MMFVADVERSIDFYKHLGFAVGNTFAADDSNKTTWAWLRSDDAQLMLGATSEVFIADEERILFYLYTDDVPTARTTLLEAGLDPGPIATPFYAPRGEFKLTDPDGYVLMITHT